MFNMLRNWKYLKEKYYYMRIYKQMCFRTVILPIAVLKIKNTHIMTTLRLNFVPR